MTSLWTAMIRRTRRHRRCGALATMIERSSATHRLNGVDHRRSFDLCDPCDASKRMARVHAIVGVGSSSQGCRGFEPASSNPPPPPPPPSRPLLSRRPPLGGTVACSATFAQLFIDARDIMPLRCPMRRQQRSLAASENDCELRRRRSGSSWRRCAPRKCFLARRRRRAHHCLAPPQPAALALCQASCQNSVQTAMYHPNPVQRVFAHEATLGWSHRQSSSRMIETPAPF